MPTYEIDLDESRITYDRIFAAASVLDADEYVKTTPEEIAQCALVIATEYQDIELTLTVRQLYYQFVARHITPNGQPVYDRICNTVAKARLTGRFPMKLIEDRSRTVGRTDSLTDDLDVDYALDRAARQIGILPSWNINRSRWFGQPELVSVWLEKEALAGVFEGTCNALGVGLFPCKGYSSVTALAEWLKMAALATADDSSRICTVLYFGDHDPDGMEIPDSAERNIQTMLQHGVIPGRCPEGQDWNTKEVDAEPLIVRFDRKGLTLEQIEEYDCPPFMAKPSSARYRNYVARFGMDNAWELDALEPRVMQRLVRRAINERFDTDVRDTNLGLVVAARTEMVERMDADFVAEALENARSEW